MLPPPDLTRLDEPTTRLLLEIFAERYRLELAAEEDVFRTMPFFATSLGLAALPFGYLAQAFPWSAVWDLRHAARPWIIGSTALLAAAALLLTLATFVLLLRATRAVRRRRPFDERYLLQWITLEPAPDLPQLCDLILRDLARVTPLNRDINERRYTRRSQAAQCLIVGLLFSLCACLTTFILKQLGFIP